MRQPLEEEKCASVLQFADAAPEGVAARVGLTDICCLKNSDTKAFPSPPKQNEITATTVPAPQPEPLLR
jgi:hypothetical protein